MKRILLTLILVCGSQVLMGAVIKNIPSQPLLTLPDLASNERFDVNSDGIDDFTFGGVVGIGTAFGTIGSNRYLAIPAILPDLGGSPAALQPNFTLGPAVSPSFEFLSTDVLDGFVSPEEAGFQNTNLILCLSSGCTGNFFNSNFPGSGNDLNALLGFEFEAEDGVHFGFFDLTFTPFSTGGFINGWAYESEPNTPITTRFLTVPEPSVLFFSFFGLIAVLGRRRCRR